MAELRALLADFNRGVRRARAAYLEGPATDDELDAVDQAYDAPGEGGSDLQALRPSTPQSPPSPSPQDGASRCNAKGNATAAALLAHEGGC
jgi:hypothetical protein